MYTYTQPQIGGTVTVPLTNNPFPAGVYIFHQYGGYYLVVGADNSNLTIENIGSPNSPAPGSIITHTGAKILVAGAPGVAGEKGEQGDRGQQGVAGTPGAPGKDGHPGASSFGGGCGGGCSGSGCCGSSCGADAKNTGICVYHPGHGFKPGDALIVSNDPSKEFELASAGSYDTSIAVGIVSCVKDKDSFIIVENGRVEFDYDELPVWAPDGLVPGGVYYLSDTPGHLSLNPGYIVKACMVGWQDNVGLLNTYAEGGGSPGPAGLNAFTTTYESFQQPVGGGSVTLKVINSSFISPGQVLYVAGGGYYQVTEVPTEYTVNVINLDYLGNTAPGAIIPSGALVSPAGLRGVSGAQGERGEKGDKGDKGDQGNQGIPGVPGDRGADGAAGLNAFAATTIEGTQGSPGIPDTFTVDNPSWVVPGQYIFIQGSGYYIVIGIVGNDLQVILQPWGVVPPPGTVIPVGSKVTPAGVEGPAGAQGPAGQTGAAGVSGLYYNVEYVNNTTYDITPYNNGSATIGSIFIKTAAGTCTATVLVNGVAITGAEDVSVSSTPTTLEVSQAITTGDSITMIVTNSTEAVRLSLSINLQ